MRSNLRVLALVMAGGEGSRLMPLTIERSTIDGNQANGQGGGIANLGNPSAAITITDSTIVGNISGGVSAEGGGIFHDDGTIGHLVGPSDRPL